VCRGFCEHRVSLHRNEIHGLIPITPSYDSHYIFLVVRRVEDASLDEATHEIETFMSTKNM
jgi:hypothetical protein